MNLRRAAFVLLSGTGLMIADPAFSQQASAPAASPPATPATAPDSDPTFMTGLRRVGVMAGQVIQCSTEADKKTQIADAMQLSNQIALHFGLAAAFNFSAAVGYGAGKPVDKSACPAAVTGWDGIKQKYLGQ